MPYLRKDVYVAPPRAPEFETLHIRGNVVTPPGMVGDGVTNDSVAIMTAINAAPNGTRFYFPARVYKVDSADGPPPLGIWVQGRANMEFFGDGEATIFKFDSSKTGHGILTFVECDNFLFHHLVFDNAGSPAFGGIRMYGMRRLEIHDCIFDDTTSQNNQPEGMDRYGLAMGHGNRTHQDIRFYRNRFNKVQCEFNHTQRADIRDNWVYRGWQTCGIGLFTNGEAAMAEDILIEDNTLIDPQPPGSSIAVHMDPPQDDNCIFRRIAIRGNHILVKDPTLSFAGASPNGGISIGQPFLAAVAEGNCFEDIAVVGNHMRRLVSGGEAFISILANPTYFNFYRFHIKDNVITVNGPMSDIRYLREGTVSGNTVTLKADVGGWVLTGSQEVELKNNRVIASFATSPYYYLQDAIGWNTYGPNNTGTGGTGTPYTFGNNTPAASDVVVP